MRINDESLDIGNTSVSYSSNSSGSWMDAVQQRLRYVWVDNFSWSSPGIQIMIAPIIVYWVLAALFDVLDRLKLPFTERHKIVRKDSTGRKNAMPLGHVVRRVMLQHALQALMAATMLTLDPHSCDATRTGGVLQSVWQIAKAMFVMDTWQYFLHRAMHHKSVYRHVHLTHHMLYQPYAYGALYNHPVESVLLDSLGGVVSHYASGISCELVVWFFSFATAKTVCDHSGYRFPVNPLHDLMPNCAAYHDVHHDIRGIKKNFSQPFFTHWDWLLGTYADASTWHVPAEIVKAGKGVKAGAAVAVVDRLATEAVAESAAEAEACQTADVRRSSGDSSSAVPVAAAVGKKDS